MISTHDEDADVLPFPVLVADIGGTNTRFSLLRDADAEPETLPIAHTADFESLDEAIRRIVLEHRETPPRSAVLAVAGPIDGDEIDLTNAPWVVRPRTLIEDLGFAEIIVMNDFEAQALAVASLPDDQRRQIGRGSVQEGASRVVVGPGTGLGVAGLVRARGFWIPVAGEGGHVDLGPRTDRDRQIWPHLQTIEGRVAAEQVLCGRGLVNLYRAICAADGVEAVHETPASVTDAALAGNDQRAGETVALFAVYLGRLAGDLALVFMARGGVYIGGGIVPHLISILKADEVRAAFEDKAPHAALMREIPLFAITQPLAALAGLAAYAREPRLFGLETEGRRWTA